MIGQGTLCPYEFAGFIKSRNKISYYYINTKQCWFFLFRLQLQNNLDSVNVDQPATLSRIISCLIKCKTNIICALQLFGLELWLPWALNWGCQAAKSCLVNNPTIWHGVSRKIKQIVKICAVCVLNSVISCQCLCIGSTGRAGIDFYLPLCIFLKHRIAPKSFF